MSFLDNPNEYESRINRGSLWHRSSQLDGVVAAIKAYVADQTGYNLTAVQTALASWKQRDPKEYFNRGRLLQEVLEAEIAEHGKRVWGTGAIPMVDHTCHPAYEPQKWRGLIETSTNCYAYACDDPFGHRAGDKPQPGEGAGYLGWIRPDPADPNLPKFEGSDVRHAVMMDDLARHKRRLARLVPLIRLRDDPVPDLVVNVRSHYLIALVTDRYGHDYHWLRQDDDGMWSHKRGSTPVTRLDASGAEISDPRTCDMTYPVDRGWLAYQFTTFYYVPKGGVVTGPLGDAP